MYSGKKAQHDFPKMRGGGIKGRLELFQKFIRFGIAALPLIMIICHFSMFPQGHMNSEASAWWGLNIHQSDTIWICLLRHFVKSDSRFWYNVIWPRLAPYWIQRRGWVAEILIFHRPLSAYLWPNNFTWLPSQSAVLFFISCCMFGVITGGGNPPHWMHGLRTHYLHFWQGLSGQLVFVLCALRPLRPCGQYKWIWKCTHCYICWVACNGWDL